MQRSNAVEAASQRERMKLTECQHNYHAVLSQADQLRAMNGRLHAELNDLHRRLQFLTGHQEQFDHQVPDTLDLESLKCFLTFSYSKALDTLRAELLKDQKRISGLERKMEILDEVTGFGEGWNTVEHEAVSNGSV